ncbi:transferrin receptor 2 [Pelobates cultripes]|uniref:Transferrin receptor 2 n=1 Tax=Pelobates cultripes TaxID=61616 RepID=A0AAD1RJQ5_PELCU|nr:transferrin receptor 2 [Pelobates cultripes]
MLVDNGVTDRLDGRGYTQTVIRCRFLEYIRSLISSQHAVYGDYIIASMGGCGDGHTNNMGTYTDSHKYYTQLITAGSFPLLLAPPPYCWLLCWPPYCWLFTAGSSPYCWLLPLTDCSSPLLLGPSPYCWVLPLTAGSFPLLLASSLYCLLLLLTAGSFPLLLAPSLGLNPYKYLDTKKDTYDSLNKVVDGRLPAVAFSVLEVAGLSLIKLLHDKILPLDYIEYSNMLLQHVMELNQYSKKLKAKGLSFDWLASARGDYTRATQSLKNAVSESDLHNEKTIQSFNIRIMRVEFYFLSQYVSAINTPYRHILIGRGQHTIQALLESFKKESQGIDVEDLHKKLALITWTLKGAANALSGEVWEIQESF